jgi:flagellar basal body L-ring protein FlgH
LSHGDVGSQYDLLGTVHHKARKRGNSCHYTAVCKSQASKDWYEYDDHQVYVETFMSRRSKNVLKRFHNSTSMLFYVKKAALPVSPGKLLTIDIREDDHSSSSSSHTSESYNKRYGSADASWELNVPNKSSSAILETFVQRRAILSQAFLQQDQGHYCFIC